MLKINKNFQNINQSYLFTEISRRVATYSAKHPDKKVIKMGIGDVTRPLAPMVIAALHDGVDNMSRAETFKGYGPEQGYDFLRSAVSLYYKKENDVDLDLDEIFISDGAKSDIGNILDLFSADNTVLMADPVYPVYADTNVMAGRRIIYAAATEANGFLPMPDATVEADIIYVCSPNNPTGAVYNRDQLKAWVDYALAHRSIILFDAAYESFINDNNLPRSIYEIEGAKQCAIEICSLSKTAGFTGTRCGYTIVPHKLKFDGIELNHMWLRRQTTKFNGVPYIVQMGAAMAFSPEGRAQSMENIEYYRRNARVITETFDEMGVWYTGGKCSPYVWFKCFDGMGSWDFFDWLLHEKAVVGTPGVGFGANGEGFFRLSSFGTYENTVEAMNRINSR